MLNEESAPKYHGKPLNQTHALQSGRTNAQGCKSSTVTCDCDMALQSVKPFSSWAS